MAKKILRENDPWRPNTGPGGKNNKNAQLCINGDNCPHMVICDVIWHHFADRPSSKVY